MAARSTSDVFVTRKAFSSCRMCFKVYIRVCMGLHCDKVVSQYKQKLEAYKDTRGKA